MDKQTVRQEYLLKRRQLSIEAVSSMSELISQRLQSLIDWRRIRSAHIYQSRVDLREVDTLRVIEYLRTNWPHINLTVGEASPSAPQPIIRYDLILVPLVAFDARRNRLGFGGGWYDRFLASQPQAITIGLAYDFQLCAVLPVESHDVALSRIITDVRAL